MQKKLLGITTALAGWFIITATAVQAATPANLVSAGRTNPPVGHYEFCRSNPGECVSLGKDRGPMQLTRKAWSQILSVNAEVNAQITPETDEQIFGVPEKWAYPTTVGDCEDYVLLKRKRLIQAGFNAQDLLITVVLQPNGEGHAVLTVRTDYGDYILDNMRGDVRLWSETGYTFVKRQSPVNSAEWTRLGPGSTTAVGAVNQ